MKCQNFCVKIFKGELQRQNKSISSERPFKILQNEIKIIKIPWAVLEIFSFRDQDLGSFPRKNDRKPKIDCVTLDKNDKNAQ